MIKFNQGLHNHTTYSDGNDSIEDLVTAAIDLGFEYIGISDHSYTNFDESYCMGKDKLADYIAECKRVKEKYRDKITVLCGLEVDYYSDTDAGLFDYTVGSVHYIKKDSEYIPVDESSDILLEACKTHYGGDIYSLCDDYYSLVGNLSDCDIVGHFDLITKFCEKVPKLIDTADPRYQKARNNAILKLIKSGKVFEINTGAVARGYKTVPYPDADALGFIIQNGGKLTLSSDCHDKKYLDCKYIKSLELASKCGAKCIYLYKNGKFKEEPIC